MNDLDEFLNVYLSGNPALEFAKGKVADKANADARRKSANEIYQKMKAEVQGMSYPEKVMIAAGHETDKLLSGAMDTVDTVRGMFGDSDAAIRRQQSRAAEQAALDQAYAPFKDNAGIMPQITGGALPYVLDSVLLGPQFAKGAGKVLNAADKGVRTAARTTGEAGKTIIQKLAEQPGMAGKLGVRIQEEWVQPIQKIASRLKNQIPEADPFRPGMAKNILGDITLGGVEGLVHYDNSVADGALASGLGSITGQAVKPMLHRLPSFYNDNEKRLIEWGKDRGYKFLPGMESGHRGHQMFEQDLRGSSSWTDVINQIDRNNDFITNRIAFEQLGVPPGQLKDLNPDVLKKHMDNLSSEYENFVKGTKVRIEPEDLIPIKEQVKLLETIDTKSAKKVAATANDYLNKLEELRRTQLPSRDPLTGRMQKSAFGGEAYQAFRKDVKSEINQAYEKQNTQLAEALTPILKTIDIGIERGAKDFGGEVGAAQWKDLNERWALSNLLMEEGMDDLGMVRGKKLSTHFMSSDPKRYLMETAGPKMNELFKAAKLEQMTRNQASGGLFDEANGLMHNPGKKSTIENLLSSPMAPAASFTGLPQLSMAMYKRGFPTSTGLLGFDGSPFMNAPMYTRSIGQASQFYPSVADNLEKAYSYISSLPAKIRNKIGMDNTADLDEFLKGI